MDDATELALARELLAVEDDQELEVFLGKLFKGAVRGVRRFAKSKVGRALGGALKAVAKGGLPLAGKALGNLVIPGVGGVVGGQLGKLATKLFEVEGDEFETELDELDAARRFVRVASQASQRAARMPAQVSPKRAALAAIESAIKNQRSSPTRTTSGRPQQGRWIRRGNKVILLGL
jgi:hypothetical protein